VGVRGPARVTLVLSVGADGLPSSAVYRTEQAGVRSSVTVRYTGWGLPVRIPDVPSSEVVEAETTDT
jgi:sugar/nucleoside kinase (ribokinase family)